MKELREIRGQKCIITEHDSGEVQGWCHYLVRDLIWVTPNSYRGKKLVFVRTHNSYYEYLIGLYTWNIRIRKSYSKQRSYHFLIRTILNYFTVVLGPTASIAKLMSSIASTCSTSHDKYPQRLLLARFYNLPSSPLRVTLAAQ